MNEYHFTNGTNQRIGVLLREDHSYAIEAWGSKAQGWCAYLVKGTIGVRISDRYTVLRDLKDAAWRAFQVDVRAPRGTFHDRA